MTADRLICQCMQVERARVIALVEAGADLEAIRRQTAAGTGCGTCRPALRRLVRRARWRRMVGFLWR